MEKGRKAYVEVLRLVRRLPADTRMHYAKYTSGTSGRPPKLSGHDPPRGSLAETG
ncbi:hypothetical protein KSP39_PZI000133 [Platanthera zijinensis]|uniref:Uncharacterized protein n=1 Tax=Platanthera zijinensis TaxID=2320716 RepID=A0AAP0C3R7_9ASPA